MPCTPHKRRASDLLNMQDNSAHADACLGLPPGQLATLLDYITALLVVPDHTQEAAAAINMVCSTVAAVGERYRQQKDLLSLVLLYESTQAELDVPGVLGRCAKACTGFKRMHGGLALLPFKPCCHLCVQLRFAVMSASSLQLSPLHLLLSLWRPCRS